MLLADDEVHVWRIFTDRETDPAVPRQILSHDELAKADRFRFERDRLRCAARRAALRKILAGYLETSPETLTFRYGPQGKPELSGPFAQSGYRFNLSFSGKLALCAVARCPLGLDLERERMVENAALVAKHYFTVGEIAVQNAAEDANRVFLRHWTRKEALIKATGSGLAVPLNTFDVSQSPGHDAWQVTLPDASGEVTTWWLQDLLAPSGWLAAIATAHRPEKLEWRDAL
jgi:4'-phosphopantetheinyl transferase